MIYITLACQLGLSTELVVKKMKSSAQGQGIEADIHASSLEEFIANPGKTDVLLIGPQVKYMFKKAKAACEPLGIPVGVIDTRDYGLQRGDRVLAQAVSIRSQASRGGAER